MARSAAKKVKHDDEAVKRMSDKLKEAVALQEKIDAIQSQFEKEVHALQKKFMEQQKPLKKEREQKLESIPEFWSKALTAHDTFTMVMQDSDLDILKHCINITADETENEEDNKRTVRVEFHFKENPHIADKVLWKQVTTNIRVDDKKNEEEDEETFIEIKQSGIDWKDEKIKKKREKDLKRKADDVDGGFLTFFEEEGEEDIDLCDALQETLLQDPISYYLVGEADEDVVGEDDE